MKTIRPLVIVAIVVLAGSAVGVAAQSEPEEEARSSGLVTEVVEPSVERVLADEAGHDLTARYPDNHRDMDHLAIAPDGTVWIASTASGSDNDHLVGFQVWALGKPGIYGLADGVPEHISGFTFLPDGTLAAVGSGIATFDGVAWSHLDASHRVVAPDGTLWLIHPDGGVEAWDGTTFTRHLPGTYVFAIGFAPDGTLWAAHDGGASTFDGVAWSPSPSRSRLATPDGTLWLLTPEGGGVEAWDGTASTGYLTGRQINEIALAPDGAIWAIGSVGPDENGGVYIIRPPGDA